MQIRRAVPDYEKSASSAQRIKDAFTEPTNSFTWVGNSSRFTFRKCSGPGKHTFMVVDPDRRMKEPAFDHELLASLLSSRGIEAGPDTLPFSWFHYQGDGKSILFRAAEKNWQFNENGLAEYHGDIDGTSSESSPRGDRNTGNEHMFSLRPLVKELPSMPSERATRIKFVNRTSGPISLWWIDWDSNLRFYAKVEAGASNTRPTYIKHVWRATRSGSEVPLASFMARADRTVAVIDEGLVNPPEEVENIADTKPASTESSKHIFRELQVFVKDHNVWTIDREHQATQLSTGGTKENPFDDEPLRSPDHRYVVMWQYIPAQDHTVYHVESNPKDQLQPRLKEFQYLKPGDRVRVDRPRMFDIANMKEIPTEDALFQNPYSLTTIGWDVDSREYRFIYNERGHKLLRIIGMSTEGQVRTIFEETSQTFVDYSNKLDWHYIEETDELIWMSERDGWNHLYLFELQTGALKNQITSGEWVVNAIDEVDADTRQVWLRAYGVFPSEDPYYAHLVRTNLDGSGLTVLTSGNGTHQWQFSPSRAYLLDTWSRVDAAPRTVLRSALTGSQLVEIDVWPSSALDSLTAAGWSMPSPHAAPGRDGQTPIHGVIVAPSHLDPLRKYPVIEQIYAGPHSFFVPKAFSTLQGMHELAELGFVVVRIDGMGTNWRSRAFHDVCHKNIRDAGLPDRIAWMQHAARSRPWMDLERVGVFGGSAGGQNAVAALLWHGAFYKAACADCGCHDNRMDKLWWNEQWMGWPVDIAYEESSNVVHAERLRGRLLLSVGELDVNVDPASTMQLVGALNRAGKDYELVFVPGASHGVGSSDKYVVSRQRDFFVRHLMGVEPPNRNEI